MPHVPVPVVRPVVVVLAAHVRRRYRRRRVLVRARDRRAPVVPRAHLQPVGRQVVVPTVHERVYHDRSFTGPASPLILQHTPNTRPDRNVSMDQLLPYTMR